MLDRQSHHDAEVAPELAELNLLEKPDGPAAAAMLSAGIGVFALGLLTTLAEAYEGLAGFLEIFQGPVGVGPLAGKATLSMVAWLISWAVLAVVWRRRDVNLKSTFYIGLALGVLGAIGTFPIFFQLFAAE
jgi:hypothetical protein